MFAEHLVGTVGLAAGCFAHSLSTLPPAPPPPRPSFPTPSGAHTQSGRGLFLTCQEPPLPHSSSLAREHPLTEEEERGRKACGSRGSCWVPQASL